MGRLLLRLGSLHILRIRGIVVISVIICWFDGWQRFKLKISDLLKHQARFRATVSSGAHTVRRSVNQAFSLVRHEDHIIIR